jgi:hypothetical protein
MANTRHKDYVTCTTAGLCVLVIRFMSQELRHGMERFVALKIAEPKSRAKVYAIVTTIA